MNQIFPAAFKPARTRSGVSGASSNGLPVASPQQRRWPEVLGAADFANTFHTKCAFRVVAFYENRNNLRMVISGWEHILVEAGIIEAFAFFVGHFLTDSPADTLKDAPLYLTFAQAWINNLADIMGGSNFENFDKTKFHIHFDFCGLSGERQGVVRYFALADEELFAFEVRLVGKGLQRHFFAVATDDAIFQRQS